MALAPRDGLRRHLGLAAAHLAGVVDEVDRAIAAFGDLAPFLDDHVLRGVVVLGDFVARDEGVDDQDVDLLVDDLRDQRVDHRPHDHGAVPGHRRDDERLVAPAVHEQPVADILRASARSA